MYEAENTEVKEEIFIPYTEEITIKSIDLIGGSENISYTRTPEGILIRIPKTEVSEIAPIAHVFRLN